MLGKLLKHEFKALSKTIVTILLLVLATSVASAFLTRLTGGMTVDNEIRGNFISGIFSFVSGVGMFALLAMPFISLILVLNRFHTNLFKDEGYLTFTLPVKTQSIYIAKLIGGAVMLILATVVGITGFIFTLMVLSGDNINFINWDILKGIYTFINEVLKIEFTSTQIILIIEFFFYVIIEMFGLLMLIYLTISISCTKFTKHRVLKGIGIYYLMGQIKNLIGIIGISLVPGIAVVGDDLDFSMYRVTETVTIYMLVLILVSLGISIGVYFYNNKIFSTKLNLD